MALVGNLICYLRTKSETENVTPDTAFRFNSKDYHPSILRAARTHLNHFTNMSTIVDDFQPPPSDDDGFKQAQNTFNSFMVIIVGAIQHYRIKHKNPT
jgi:hypothetical protein